jgi:cyanate permease
MALMVTETLGRACRSARARVAGWLTAPLSWNEVEGGPNVAGLWVAVVAVVVVVWPPQAIREVLQRIRRNQRERLLFIRTSYNTAC